MEQNLFGVIPSLHIKIREGITLNSVCAIKEEVRLLSSGAINNLAVNFHAFNSPTTCNSVFEKNLHLFNPHQSFPNSRQDENIHGEESKWQNLYSNQRFLPSGFFHVCKHHFITTLTYGLTVISVTSKAEFTCTVRLISSQLTHSVLSAADITTWTPLLLKPCSIEIWCQNSDLNW